MLALCAAVGVFAQVLAGQPAAGRNQEALLVAEEVFTGTVTSVEDGDSVVVKTSTDRGVIHLAGIDAPELSQPGGAPAKTFLSGLTLGKTVTVRLKSPLERLARLEVGGADVTEALIRAGMGWHCPRFAEERGLMNAESEARRVKRGLWSEAQPRPPWLHRGAGACSEEKKTPQASPYPDFSGRWTAISPSARAGERLSIAQDAISLTLLGMSDRGEPPLTYRLNGATSVALVTPHGPVDIVAKARWSGRALILEERRWEVLGEEATSVRQVLWVDDRGLLNLEVSTPRPIGESDAIRLVLRRDASPGPPAK